MTGLTSESALASGLHVTDNQNYLAGHPFSVHRWAEDSLVDPFDMLFALGADVVDGNDYALLDVTCTDPGVEYLVRQAGDGDPGATVGKRLPIDPRGGVQRRRGADPGAGDLAAGAGRSEAQLEPAAPRKGRAVLRFDRAR